MPKVVYFLAGLEAHQSRLSRQASASIKYFIFTLGDQVIWVLMSMVIANIAAGSTNGYGRTIKEALFDMNWAQFGAFYGNFFVIFALVNNGIRLSALIEFVKYWTVKQIFLRASIVAKRELDEPESFPYWFALTDHVVLILILMIFAPIVPLLIPLAVMYFTIELGVDKIEMRCMRGREESSDTRIAKRFYFYFVSCKVIGHLLWVSLSLS